ncbi:MAG: pyridoxamine 5'-phosphate oxidase family protein [Actinomycetota bacterium]
MAGPPKNFASLLRARRAYLATSGPDGTAEVAPVCFTWAGEAIWIAVEAQRRLRAAGMNKVTFMVDRWDEDWAKLSWLVAKGRATVLPDGPEADRALAALESKYQQYLKNPHDGSIIRLDVESWKGTDALDPDNAEYS